MAKDSFWFKHDSTAGRGLRMRKMAHIYGHWGKGIYWDVIEILRDQEDYTFNSDNSSLQLLSNLIGCNDHIKFINWINDCFSLNLLKNENGVFFSEVLIEKMGVWETKKLNGSKGGRGKKSESKAELKRIESETIPKQKRIESIREDKIREDDILNKVFTDFNELNQDILLNDGIWRNAICAKYKLYDTWNDYGRCVEAFINHLITSESEGKTKKDFKNHFNNWLNQGNNLKYKSNQSNL